MYDLLFDKSDILLGPGFLKNTALVARRSQGARRGKGERLDVGRYEERLESSFHSETCKRGHETTINQTAKESVMKKQECGMSGDGVRQNDGGFKRRHLLLTSLVAASALLGAGVAIPAQAQQPASTPPNGKPPNILVIMTDDVGIWNISAYHRGMMGGRTPNIDRIAKEGALFTDYYAQQSCTAGRAAFILDKLRSVPVC